MPLTFIGDSNPVAGTTSATASSASTPGTFQTGDLLVLFVANKPATTTPSTPSGWNLAATVSVGTGTNGAGTGPVRLTAFWRVATSGQTIPAITNSGTGAVISAGLGVYRPDAGETISIVTSSGSDTVANTSWSVTGNTTIDIIGDDRLLALVGITNITPTFSSPSLTVPGLTLDTLGNPYNTSTGNGNDLRQALWRRPVLSGTASGPPTFTATMSTGTNATGGVLFIRLRSVSSVSAPVVDAGSDVASHTVSTQFSRTMGVTDSPTSYAWTIQSGPSGVGNTISTAAALAWTPSVTGTYVLQAAATNAGGTGTDTMSITVVASGGGGGTGEVVPRTATLEEVQTSSIVPDMSTAQVGDLALLTVACGTTINTPSGWTPCFTQINTVVDYAAFYRFLDGGAADDPTVTTSSGTRLTAIVQPFGGVDPDTPLDVTPGTTSGSSSTSVTTPSINAVTDGAVAVSGYAMDASSATYASTPSAGWTEIMETTGTGRRQGVARKSLPSGGATGTCVWTQSGGSLQMVGFTLALRPAPASAPSFTPRGAFFPFMYG